MSGLWHKPTEKSLRVRGFESWRLEVGGWRVGGWRVGELEVGGWRVGELEVYSSDV